MSCVFARARPDDPITAPSTKVSKNNDGMSASVAENASEDAAETSLFFWKEETLSNRMILIFFKQSPAIFIMAPQK